MPRKQDKNLENGIETQFKSGENAAKNGQKGGIASGEAKRRKKSMSELAKVIASADVKSEKTKKQLESLGIEQEDMQNNVLVTAAIFQSAVSGDMKAVEKWQELTENEKADESGTYDLPARVFSKEFLYWFLDLKPNIKNVLKGGRGSGKSSIVSLVIIWLIKNNPNMHAAVIRKVAGTLRDSVYAQIKWAIHELNLDDEFEAKVSPLEITYKKTGQKIYFRGCDDPIKLKSIKPPFGYNGIMWVEEADQLSGAEELRSIEQSVLRGGSISYEFISYNPPKSKDSWVNKELLIPDENRVVHHSSYLDVRPAWLGQKFIDDAEHLKEVNPTAYEHEYLGIPNGSGGNVFDNIEVREITDAEINRFDRIYQGVDFGWFPDQFAFLRTHYDSAREKIYLMDELYVNKQSNAETGKWIKDKGYDDFHITCDSAEPKSVNDYRDMGLPARGAIKGAGSVEYGFKWLQSRTLVIDPARTPNALKEIAEYEYERDKEGNVISGYPDGNDHAISALRYAYESLFNKRGTSA